jgi:hypothetical protein
MRWTDALARFFARPKSGFAVPLLISLLPTAAFTQTAVPPPGEARIWVYRLYEPYVSEARPYVRLNGAVVGISDPGGAFYRDVPPGTYAVTVDSQGTDYYQFASVAVVAGQTVYVRIYVDDWWRAINPNYAVDTFYTRVIPVPWAQWEMSHTRVYGTG